VAQVIWSPRALADIAEIRNHIGRTSPLAAQRMSLRLVRAGDALGEFPDRGRPARRGLRELAIIYPYLIRYRVRRDHVEIVRIKHGAQEPGG
jgi:plasmid stabilization system protein ParE